MELSSRPSRIIRHGRPLGIGRRKHAYMSIESMRRSLDAAFSRPAPVVRLDRVESEPLSLPGGPDAPATGTGWPPVCWEWFQ